MIRYLQFDNKYTEQVYNLIYNIMKLELEISSNLIDNILQDLNNIKDNYIDKGGNFWIAIDTITQEVVGTVGILKIDNETVEFKRFYVKKEYRNRHIGDRLYKIAEDYVKDSKIKTLYLVSGNKSKIAYEIYYKNGWKTIDKDNLKVNIFIRDGVKLYKKELVQEKV